MSYLEPVMNFQIMGSQQLTIYKSGSAIKHHEKKPDTCELL